MKKASYYFPTFIKSLSFHNEISPALKYTTQSGTAALKLLLRSYNLNKKTKIAIPAFVCSSVKEAVENENLTPVLFDLKNNHSFWTEYDLKKIIKEKVQAIILVHLYGFIHPDTELISNFCSENNIILIHDAAQSYGIDEQSLKDNDIVYSFGPGKSTTAAGGGWIKSNSDLNYYSTNVTKASFISFQNVNAKHFLKTRIYNYRFTKSELLINTLIKKIAINSSCILEMSSFQKQAASYAILQVNEIKQSRKKRHNILAEKIKNNTNLFLAYNDCNGLYFKAVLFIKQNPFAFKSYLTKNNVPYFSLFEDDNLSIPNTNSLPVFKDNASHFIEISTEASIPEEEIERVAILIAAY